MNYREDCCLNTYAFAKNKEIFVKRSEKSIWSFENMRNIKI